MKKVFVSLTLILGAISLSFGLSRGDDVKPKESGPTVQGCCVTTIDD